MYDTFDGRSGLISYVTYELTHTMVKSFALNLGYAEERADKFASDSALTAATMVATTSTLLTHDALGAIIAAGFIGLKIGAKMRQGRKS